VFFRIWFYLCKVAGVAFSAAFLGLIGGLVWQPLLWVFIVGLLLIIPLGIAGGLLGFAVFICGMKMSCPLCGQPGDLSGDKETLCLDCENCGTVYGQIGASSLFDWQLYVDVEDDEDELDS
jgi:hypothetical protein